ncbi:monovalent cation/H+ antiporter complex subunit F [Clostridium sardiniense]|uniref:monovalent cation/H+ antiporter complex subunit F n=1 Tax=Clostridium sardiniense TaxID=29369 RepID=UPI001FAF45A7|nr:monovalent cation/H+ antiporter complex subunit F [Clostridium sardiniense]MBM7833641.1 multisubunit Na+/H+ antiporter MnhF subunit [Clostridium sardiniense]
MIDSIMIIVEILLGLLAVSLLYKVFKGPTIIDRVMCADCIDIILGVLMVVYGAKEERALFVDLGLVLTLLGFVGTVLICKYLEGKL